MLNQPFLKSVRLKLDGSVVNHNSDQNVETEPVRALFPC